MEIQKCAIKNCNNPGFILFGNKFICGECYVKIINKEKERQDKLIEEMEI